MDLLEVAELDIADTIALFKRFFNIGKILEERLSIALTHDD